MQFRRIVLKKPVKKTQEGQYCGLNENSPAIDGTPDAFRGVTLLPHQLTVVQALLDVEANRSYVDGDMEHKTIAAALREPFGSGKTYSILAMIMVRPVPTPVVPFVSITDSYGLHVKYTGTGVLIRSNVIVVGASVLYQWEKVIKERTTLKVLTVADYYGMRTFLNLFNAKKLYAFDIILLKNGTMTGYLSIPDDVPNPPEMRSLIDVMHKITCNCVFARVIYDDYDTINVPQSAPVLNTLFTVYVSATRKRESSHIHTPDDEKLSEKLKTFAPRLTLAADDDLLFKFFSVQCAESYVEASTRIPPVHGRVYTLVSHADAYTGMLKSMNDADANEIMDMLNGDAFETAAARLGIVSTSPVDIFQRVLDDKYDMFVSAQKSLSAVDASYDLLDTLDEHPKGKSHSEEKCRAEMSRIKKGQCIGVKYYSESIRKTVDDANDIYTDKRDIAGAAIDRTIANIKSGGCQVCTLDFTDGVFIMKCCGIILCNTCYTRGNNIRKQLSGKVKTITGSCANCKKTIYPQVDTIFVDKSVDIQKLFDRDSLDTITGEISPPTDDSEPVVVANKKLQKLIDIINGTADGFETRDIKIKGLINRKSDTKLPEPAVRKLLVFTEFAETTALVIKELKANSVNVLRLGGTSKQKADIVEQFRGSTENVVLVINSREDCAGLNLQMATDAIMFQKSRDEHIAAQIAGRAQRIGRTSELTIHWLQYTNEV